MKGELQYGVLDGKEVCIHLSDVATRFLGQSERPIYVGMELYFTYFMRKKVCFFDEKPDRDFTKISKYLYLSFRPLQSKLCNIKDLKGDESDLIDLPIIRQGALIPSFVRIDRKKNNWTGDFTWKSGYEKFKPLDISPPIKKIQ